jgi:succinate dehydrogenase flavin-adding protein (antitoxin of CptAB toxin-antitoxin module)
MTEMFTAAGELNRLRWRCSHRALREMDLLLGGFFDEHFSSLTAQQAAAFVKLADMEDLDLWPLITGKRECADAVQAEVVSMLRDVRVK